MDFTTLTEKAKKDVSKPPNDSVYGYAKDTLALGLLLMEFIDAMREGDGNRIFVLFCFYCLKSSRHINYSIEAVTLLAQYHYLYSPRMAAQLAGNTNSQYTRMYWQKYLI